MERISSIIRHALHFKNKYYQQGICTATHSQIQHTLRQLSTLMDGLDKEQLASVLDLGIVEQAMRNDPKNIGYLSLWEDQGVSLCSFALPKGSRLPLHDHPNMYVLSRVPMGQLSCVSLDLHDQKLQVELPQQMRLCHHPHELHVLQNTTDQLLAQQQVMPQSWQLNAATGVKLTTPQKDNVHSFSAEEDSLLVDLLVPGYDHVHHSCNFYNLADGTLSGHWSAPEYSTYML